MASDPSSSSSTTISTAGRQAKIFKKLDEALEVNSLIQDSREYASWKVSEDEDICAFVCKVQAPFCFADGIQLKDETFTIDGEPAGSLLNPDIDKIISKATVAPFGRGSETVVDPSVRNALEIKADRIECMDYYFKDAPLAFFRLENLRILGPRNRILRGRLYKMHIYQKGGKFDNHIDTSHGKGHLATLVAILPTEHEGGELIVEHGGKQVVIGGPKSEGEKKENKLIDFGCFYTDCVHRVMPVTSGVRIALQWDIYAGEDDDGLFQEVDNCLFLAGWEEGGKVADPSEDIVNNVAFVDAFTSCINKFMAKEGVRNLGILLRHRYPAHSLATNMLRGGDQVLFDLLKRVCSKRGVDDPIILPMLVSYRDFHEGEEYRSFWAQPITADSFETKEGKKRSHPGSISFNTGTLILGAKGECTPSVFYRRYIEHTGNEAQPEEGKYIFAALVIH